MMQVHINVADTCQFSPTPINRFQALLTASYVYLLADLRGPWRHTAKMQKVALCDEHYGLENDASQVHYCLLHTCATRATRGGCNQTSGMGSKMALF